MSKGGMDVSVAMVREWIAQLLDAGIGLTNLEILFVETMARRVDGDLPEPSDVEIEQLHDLWAGLTG